MAAENYNRFKIAEHQLEAAIRLYEEGDYLSAITLAGAPEEVLGKTYRIRGGKAAVEHMADLIIALRRNLSNGEEIVTKKAVISELNEVRNWLKHGEGQDELSFDAHTIAFAMIDRAIDNYYQVTRDETPIMREFQENHQGPHVV